ncbi:unnamed protein product, partial [Prorocentrum cordatum]
NTPVGGGGEEEEEAEGGGGGGLTTGAREVAGTGAAGPDGPRAPARPRGLHAEPAVRQLWRWRAVAARPRARGGEKRERRVQEQANEGNRVRSQSSRLRRPARMDDTRTP